MAIDILKDYRQAKGLTQQALANVLGIKQQAVQQYESGTRIPPTDILSRYAKALGCSIDELLEALPERKRA